MALTLTVADNADGTGATATIAGSLGAVTTVYVCRVSGQAGVIAVTAAGVRTGDGNASLSLSKGLYFGYAQTAGGVRSDLYYFPVTTGLDAVATRVRASVVDTIGLLTIPPAANVYEQIVPDETDIIFPCTICTVDGVQETNEQALSTVDDVGRPVKVMICDRQDKYDHSKLAQYELWRQSMERCFRNQQLAGVIESVICRIEPFVIIDPELPAFQHMVSAFVVRAQTREPRGVGV